MAASALVAALIEAMNDVLEAHGQGRPIPSGGAADPMGMMGAVYDTLLGPVVGPDGNGSYYMKLGNGVMIAWGTFTHGALGSTFNANIGTFGWSFMYDSDAITFPVPFIAAPVVVSSTSGGIGNVQALSASGFSSTPYSHSSTGPEIYWVAIGRWS